MRSTKSLIIVASCFLVTGAVLLAPPKQNVISEQRMHQYNQVNEAAIANYASETNRALATHDSAALARAMNTLMEEKKRISDGFPDVVEHNKNEAAVALLSAIEKAQQAPESTLPQERIDRYRAECQELKQERDEAIEHGKDFSDVMDAQNVYDQRLEELSKKYPDVIAQANRNMPVYLANLQFQAAANSGAANSSASAAAAN